MNEFDEEDDDWQPSNVYSNKKSSLLNPQIVCFRVDKHELEFSKTIDNQLSSDDEDDQQESPFELKKQSKHKEKQTYDELLYHPCEDELNALWIKQTVKSDITTKNDDFFQLSCSKCFTPITYQGQNLKNNKNEQKKGDYVATKVSNVLINEEKIVRSKRKIEESEEQFELYYLQGFCGQCKNEIALYDIEQKRYYLSSMYQEFKDITLLALVLLPIVMYAKHIWATKTSSYFQRKLVRNHILYVTAHPDDEAMFFVPSILELKKQNTLYLLCLSNGNADGLGKIREKEVKKCGKQLGFHEVTVLDDSRLQDGMQQYWEPEIIAEVITKYLKEKQGEQEINFIVTFDEKGISGHPNHIAVFKGVTKVFSDNQFPIDVLTLSTVNIVRKYIGYFDSYFAQFDQLHYYLLTPISSYGAMAVHHSQFVWFRKLFTIFSRYVYVNSFDHFSHNPEKYEKNKT